MVSIWDVIERAQTGPPSPEKEFDMSVFRAATRLAKEYDIRYDPENPVPHDDRLADRTYEAGVRFFLEVGVYCLDTGRIVRFTEDEVAGELGEACSSFYLGEGADRVEVTAGRPDGSREPVVCGGLQTLLYSDEETMFKVYEACAKDRRVDGIWGGMVSHLDGRSVDAKTPKEMWVYRRSAEILRRAVAAAGRPGMFLMHNAPTLASTIACWDSEKALRPTDVFESPGVSEMKTGYDDLNRAVWGQINGGVVLGGNVAVIGAYSGDPAGSAIAAVAGGLQGVMVSKAKLVAGRAVALRYKTRACREHLWTASLALQALARNTHLVLEGGIGDHPGAGPGTRQYLIESAAGHIASTVSGGHSFGGTRKFLIGSTVNFGTPFESRWMGETCKAATGMSREEANEVVKGLLEEYEPHLKEPPQGYVLEALYNVDSMTPKAEYEELYQTVRKELAAKGLGYS